MTYTNNQNLGDNYTPEAAAWCNEHGAYIEEVNSNYFVRFAPEPTEEEIELQQVEQQEKSFEDQKKEITEQLLIALLSDDQDWVEELKAQYRNLIGE